MVMEENKVFSSAQEEVNALVEKAQKAYDAFLDLNQEQIDYIVAKCSVAGLDNHGSLAKAAIEETKRGVFEDKATKNLFACEYVVNNMRHLKTVGVISEDPVSGITEIADPIGVICGITPVTNPTSTVIFKSLICLKTRNPIIFAFHPSAQECSKKAAIVMLEAAVAAGAPKDCIQWIEHPSMDATSALMNHPGVATILATGGNAMVKAAYSCGKPAMGVGAGNVPAYIHKDADVEQAVNDIVLSKSFDNGMICASEQAAIIDEEIYEEAVNYFKRFKAYFASKEDKKKLEMYMFGVTASKDTKGGKLNPDIVVITGDFIDDDTSYNDFIVGCEALGLLNTKYGVYFVYGNHDKGYFNNRSYNDSDLRRELNKNNVIILEDEKVSITDDIILIGRQDHQVSNRLNNN